MKSYGYGTEGSLAVSSRATCSGESDHPVAPRLLSSCGIPRTPMIGAVTPGFCKSQLIATCAGDRLTEAATSCRASKVRHVCSLLYALHFSPQSFFSASWMRDPSGGAVIPRLNFPESDPPRSGLQGMIPNPSRRLRGINSHSVLRHKRLYCG